MPTECPEPCGDFTFPEWQALNPKAQLYYLYCALSDAAAQGFPELIGVYTVTEDADYVAPADASLIIWNVPAQSEARFITFQGNPGQETQVLVLNSNGEFVGDAYSTAAVFALLDTAPYVVNVRVVDSTTGEIVRSDGTAAQYDVGTSGTTIPLLSTANTFEANQIIGGSTGVDGQAVLTIQRSDVPARNVQIYPSVGSDWLLLASSDSGHESGVRSEASATVASLGINVAQFGTRSNASVGGIFRLDTRTGTGLSNGEQSFIVLGVPSGGATAFARIVVSLQNGNTLLVPNGGSVTTGGAGATGRSNIADGVATLAAGTVSVTDASVTAGSIIQLTPGFAPAGMLYYTISAGVGFTIQSTNAGDAGSVSWTRIVP